MIIFKYMNLPKYSKGFTIIELLVSMSIIAIIAGGIVPTFSTYIRNQNLKQAQEQLKSDLRTVQNRALTGAFSDESIDGLRIQYWGANFTSGSGNSVTYFISTGTSCPSLVGSDPPVIGTDAIQQGEFTLPNDVNYYVSSGNCMFFSLKNGDIYGNLVSPIVLRFNADDKNSLQVNFNPAGLIETP